MEPASRENPKRSLIEILHEAPALLEALPPAALKSLSSTCKTLRTLLCARVTTITLSSSGDASKVFCTTWPNLLMVVCPYDYETRRKLPAQWEHLMDIMVQHDWVVTAVLIRSQQEPQTPLCDLPSQHYAVLSAFTGKHRCNAEAIRLRGPFVTCRVMQSLTHSSWPQLDTIRWMDCPQLGLDCLSNLSETWHSVTAVSISNSSLDTSMLLQMGTNWPQLNHLDLSNNQLDANAVWALRQVKWTDLDTLSLSVNKLGCSAMQQLVFCSWPSLRCLILEDACINAPALQCLAQGQRPELMQLNLNNNCINTNGISYLLKGSWPQLSSLSLSARGLDYKAYSLLGLTEEDKYNVMAGLDSVSDCKRYVPHLLSIPEVATFSSFSS